MGPPNYISEAMQVMRKVKVARASAVRRSEAGQHLKLGSNLCGNLALQVGRRFGDHNIHQGREWQQIVNMPTPSRVAALHDLLMPLDAL